MEQSAGSFFDIRMFGGFALNFEGKEYVLGRNSSSKFIQLLQLVWLSGEEGITKEELMQSLYDRENLFNLNNSFNNLVYQMRKQMLRAGLPETDYIVRKGKYYMTDKKIPVRVDVLEFQRLAGEAERETEEEAKYLAYHQAFILYKGELLPAVSTEIWVTLESLKLKKIFDRCVDWMGEYLRREKNYVGMSQIYSRAAELYPFDDWQVKQIDALLCMGEYKEAFILYDKTVRLYSDEMGLPPSGQMMKCYERMSQKMEFCPSNLTEIQDNLQEDKKIAGGGVERIFALIPALSMLTAC